MRGQGQCATSLKALTTWSRTSDLPSACSLVKRGNGTFCSRANGFKATRRSGEEDLCSVSTAQPEGGMMLAGGTRWRVALGWAGSELGLTSHKSLGQACPLLFCVGLNQSSCKR